MHQTLTAHSAVAANSVPVSRKAPQQVRHDPFSSPLRDDQVTFQGCTVWEGQLTSLECSFLAL